MKVNLAKTDTELEIIAPMLQQLRNTLSVEKILQQIKKQYDRGYRLAYVEQKQEVQSVAGFTISCNLAWGKHMYIEDLVSNSDSRSQGFGKFILDWLKSYALENSCQQIHLDSGVQRFAAHKFYLREGFQIASHHFSIKNL
ncbi:MAG: GNAT family N-acetyltransferase [Spirochaetota bacterium]